MSLRRILGLAAGVSLLVSLVVSAPASAGAANLGPVLGPLPATAEEGGYGTEALNDLVRTSCNGGAALGFAQWFTLPSGDLGTVVAHGQSLDQRFGGHRDELIASRVALVDYVHNTVISCSGGPVAITAAHPAAAVVWVSAADEASYLSYCGDCRPPAVVSVNRTSGSAAANDAMSNAVPIHSMPFQTTGDSTAATFDGPNLPDPADCWFGIGGTYYSTVWWSWTATWTGPISTQVLADGFPGRVVMAESTPTGPVALDRPREAGSGCVDGPFEVVEGHSYLFGVAAYQDTYYRVDPISTGGFYDLYVGPPSAPSDPLTVSVQTGATSIDVAWAGSGAAAGQPDTTSFDVTLTLPGSVEPARHVSVPATTHAYSFSGLTSDRQYLVKVAATNSAGAGMPWGTYATTGYASGPGPSQVDAHVDAAAHTATLSWAPPVLGPTVTGYRVARDGTDTHGAGPWSTTVPASARSLTFTSLAGGTSYRLSVQAITANGAGRPSAVEVHVLASPEVPALIRQTGAPSTDSSAGTATISWTPPDYDGEGPITGYMVSLQPRTGGGLASGSGAFVGADERSYTFSGLLSGVEYDLSVAATNAAGTGRARTFVVGPLNPKPPSQPYSLQATVGDGRASLSWHAPDYPGTFPLSNYLVRVFDGTSDTVITDRLVDHPTTTVVVDRLVNGHSYTFDVIANSRDDVSGSFSYPSARSAEFVPGAVEPAASVPGAPIIKTASGTAAGLIVRLVARWAPPVSDGGSPVVAYRVYVYGSGPNAGSHIVTVSPKLSASHTSWTTSINVVQSYRFYVRAINAVGYSDYSARSNLVVPAKVPTAPRIAVASSGVPGGPITATARWNAPVSDGGATLTAYRVYAFHMSPSGVVLGYTMSPRLQRTVRSYTMALPAYGWYRFAVRACNGMGYSPFSAKAARVIGR